MSRLWLEPTPPWAPADPCRPGQRKSPRRQRAHAEDEPLGRFALTSVTRGSRLGTFFPHGPSRTLREVAQGVLSLGSRRGLLDVAASGALLLGRSHDVLLGQFSINASIGALRMPAQVSRRCEPRLLAVMAFDLLDNGLESRMQIRDDHLLLLAGVDCLLALFWESNSYLATIQPFERRTRARPGAGMYAQPGAGGDLQVLMVARRCGVGPIGPRGWG